MMDHVNLPVSDIQRSKRFFQDALSPLGYELLMEHRISGAGFGQAGKPDFWIKQGVPSSAVHVAFASPDRATVDAFHEAAIPAGGPAARPATGPPRRPTLGRRSDRGRRAPVATSPPRTRDRTRAGPGRRRDGPSRGRRAPRRRPRLL